MCRLTVALVVGGGNVLCLSGTYGEWSLHYGYLDLKTYFDNGITGLGELVLRINVSSLGVVWFCGRAPEALKHTTIKVEYNVALSDGQKYEPDEDKRVTLRPPVGRHYVGNECTELLALPEGTHMFALSADANYTNHISTLTHVIVW